MLDLRCFLWSRDSKQAANPKERKERGERMETVTSFSVEGRRDECLLHIIWGESNEKGATTFPVDDIKQGIVQIPARYVTTQMSEDIIKVGCRYGFEGKVPNASSKFDIVIGMPISG
jgi:hypothetical protein